MPMTYQDFFASVKAGALKNAYLFTGPEAMLKQQAVDALRALLPEGMESLNETVLEGADAQAIIEAAETMPFLCDRRLVIVRDWAPLLPGKSRAEEDEAERLTAFLKSAPDTASVVFVMRDRFDGRKKAASALAKYGAHVSFEHLDDAALDAWLDKRARASGVTLARGVSRQLVFLAGRSLTRLSGEMDKLTAYAGESGTVTLKAVEALVPPSLEATVFQMIDSALDRDLPRAFELVKTMLQSGETRTGILYMLTRQMRLLTHMKRLMEGGMTLPETERQLSLNPYAAKRMERQARRFSATQLEDAYRAAVDADFAIKSGRAHDDAALDRLLFMIGGLR